MPFLRTRHRCPGRRPVGGTRHLALPEEVAVCPQPALAAAEKVGETARGQAGVRRALGRRLDPESATGLRAVARSPFRRRRGGGSGAARFPGANQRSAERDRQERGQVGTPQCLRPSTHALNGVTQLGSIYVVIGLCVVLALVELHRTGGTMDRAVHRHRRRRRGGGIDGDQGDRRSGASGVQPGGGDPRPVVPERSHDDRGRVLRRGCPASRPPPPARPARSFAGGAVAIAVAVAASRVFLDVHWLSDVIGGLALGWAWFALCGIAFGGRLLRFGAGAEVAEAVASSPSPRTETARRIMTRPVYFGATTLLARRVDVTLIPQPDRGGAVRRTAARSDSAGGALVRGPAQSADLRSPQAAASADRLERLGRDGVSVCAARPFCRTRPRAKGGANGEQPSRRTPTGRVAAGPRRGSARTMRRPRNLSTTSRRSRIPGSAISGARLDRDRGRAGKEMLDDNMTMIASALAYGTFFAIPSVLLPRSACSPWSPGRQTIKT